MIDEGSERLDDAVQSCARHAARMRSAIEALGSAMPVVAADLSQLSDEDVRALDQLVYRFGKLQDTAGMQLFPALLAAFEEPYREWTMRDRLNRLEQLGILPDLGAWEDIRTLRNRLTHEYPNNPKRQAAILEEAWKLAPTLIQIVSGVIKGAERRLNRSLASMPH